MGNDIVGEITVSRMGVRGDSSELSDDDEISVVSDNGGDKRLTQMKTCGPDLACKRRVTTESYYWK